MNICKANNGWGEDSRFKYMTLGGVTNTPSYTLGQGIGNINGLPTTNNSTNTTPTDTTQTTGDCGFFGIRMCNVQAPPDSSMTPTNNTWDALQATVDGMICSVLPAALTNTNTTNTNPNTPNPQQKATGATTGIYVATGLGVVAIIILGAILLRGHKNSSSKK